jgi:hypothetical protein
MSEPAMKMTPFQRWYAREENRKQLSDLRKKKYRENADYRQKALDNAAKHRGKVREAVPRRPDEYAYNHSEVAKRIGVSTSVLRVWRERRYYPDPYSHNGRLYFTLEQVALLEGLAKFFAEQGRRLKPQAISTLENLVNYVHANWQ